MGLVITEFIMYSTYRPYNVWIMSSLHDLLSMCTRTAHTLYGSCHHCVDPVPYIMPIHCMDHVITARTHFDMYTYDPYNVWVMSSLSLSCTALTAHTMYGSCHHRTNSFRCVHVPPIHCMDLVSTELNQYPTYRPYIVWIMSLMS